MPKRELLQYIIAAVALIAITVMTEYGIMLYIVGR